MSNFSLLEKILYEVGAVDVVFNPQNSQTCIFSSQKSQLTYYTFDKKNSTWSEDKTSLPICTGDISAIWEPQRKHPAVFFKGEDGYLWYAYERGF